MKRYIIDSNTQGYSIIAAILMIGFLLVLTTSTLNLVLSEMQDGRGRQNYMKAYAGAEWAMELWLLKIKQHGYGYYGVLSDSDILGGGRKDSSLNYDFEGRVQSFSSSLDAYGVDIIPLFWIDDSDLRHDVNTLHFVWSTDIAWNILGQAGGISWKWNIQNSTPVWIKKFDRVSWAGTGTLSYDDISQTVGSFLWAENYLIIQNTSWASQNYDISIPTPWPNEYFTLPKSDIYSTAKLWKYTQNLRTTVDNTEFLWILKYSIYSWN